MSLAPPCCFRTALRGGFYFQSLILTVAIPILLLAPLSLSAATFKCHKEGVIDYRDRPCNEDGNIVTRPDTPKGAAPKKSKPLDKTRQMLKQLETARKKRELNYKIKSMKRDIEDIQAQRDQEVQVLKTDIEKMDDFEDVVEEEEMTARINQEIDAVNARYAAQIEELKKRLEKLQNSLQKLNQ